MGVSDYLRGREEMRRRELVWGVVREPPAPRYGHQSIVTRTTVILDLHVRERGLGNVCVSPIDVVLDHEKALVVQPDVVFISNERQHIVREQVWGAPDLVVEVSSRGTARYDRTTKLEWYRRYQVRECWLLDVNRQVVTVVSFHASGDLTRSFTGDQRVQSSVLPSFDTAAETFFD